MILLRNFITKENVLLGFSTVSQSEALKSLMQPMIDSGVVTDGDLFLSDLLDRENKMTTVMENGVAFPHARSNAIKKMAVTVGILPEPGIEFSLEQDVMSRIFFLIGVPSYAPTVHLPLLSLLAKFANQKINREKLLTVKTCGTASKILSNYKGG
ncbi:MAG: PTS sugar transporter subunit IIA [Verrucomicrobiota bacterium]|nr:PTS sugar transporter subunit IIA [Verrucomicrobiota bacterium]